MRNHLLPNGQPAFVKGHPSRYPVRVRSSYQRKLLERVGAEGWTGQPRRRFLVRATGLAPSLGPRRNMDTRG